MNLLHKIILYLLLSLFMSACSSTEEEQTLRLVIPVKPYALDPRVSAEGTSGSLALMLFEGLYRMEEHQLKPAIARKYTLSQDGKTYTFQLKKTYWTNGDLVSAKDFEYAWKNQLNPSFKSPLAYQFYPIYNAKGAKEGTVSLHDVGIKALDDFTLQVKLEAPLPYFVDLLASPTFFPINRLVNQRNPAWPLKYSRDFVCNGPFALKDWNNKQYIDLIKNPTYWDKRSVNLEKIKIELLSEGKEEGVFSAFLNGESDWAGAPLSNLSSEQFKEFSQRPDFHTYPICASYWYILNTHITPFNQPKVRRAFAYALDREGLLSTIKDAKHLPATGIVPPTKSRDTTSPFFEDGALLKAQDLFEQVLKEYGWTKHSFPEIVITINDSPDHLAIANNIKTQWEEAFHIPVDIKQLPWTEYLDTLSRGEFQVGRFGWVANHDDPMVFLELFKEKASINNLSAWEDSTYQNLLEKSNHINERNLRREEMLKAERKLVEHMPIIPLFYYQHAYLKNPSLKGFTLSSTGHLDFKKAYRN